MLKLSVSANAIREHTHTHTHTQFDSEIMIPKLELPYCELTLFASMRINKQLQPSYKMVRAHRVLTLK